MDIDIHAGSTSIEPIPVHIVGAQETEKRPPDFGSWFAFVFAGNETATRVLPQNRKRDSAQILIGPGAAGNTNGVIFIGTKEQLDNLPGANVTGSSVARLSNGQSVTIHNQQQVWVRPDGVNSLTVTILDERWQ